MSTTYATLDPVDPRVRTDAQRLAARLVETAASVSAVERFLLDVLGDVAEGNRVVVVREAQEVTPAQAADMLGVTRQFVDRLCNTDVLPCRRLPASRHRRILVSDIVSLMAERDQKQAGHAALRQAFSDAGLLNHA